VHAYGLCSANQQLHELHVDSQHVLSLTHCIVLELSKQAHMPQVAAGAQGARAVMLTTERSGKPGRPHEQGAWGVVHMTERLDNQAGRTSRARCRRWQSTPAGRPPTRRSCG
jgi:hypothetical protein